MKTAKISIIDNRNNKRTRALHRAIIPATSSRKSRVIVSDHAKIDKIAARRATARKNHITRAARRYSVKVCAIPETRKPDIVTSYDDRFLVNGENKPIYEINTLPIKEESALAPYHGATISDKIAIATNRDRKNAEKMRSAAVAVDDTRQSITADRIAHNRKTALRAAFHDGTLAEYSQRWERLDGWREMYDFRRVLCGIDKEKPAITRNPRGRSFTTAKPRNNATFDCSETLSDKARMMASVVECKIDERFTMSFLKGLESRGNEDARNIIYDRFRNFEAGVSYNDILQVCRLAICEEISAETVTVTDGALTVYNETARPLVISRIFGAMSTYLWNHRTKVAKHTYVLAPDETLVGIADRKAWSEYSDIDAVLESETIHRFFEYIRAQKPRRADDLIETARALISSRTYGEIAADLGVNVSTIAARRATLKHLYYACFAHDITEKTAPRADSVNGVYCKRELWGQKQQEYGRKHETARRHGNWKPWNVANAGLSYKHYFTTAELCDLFGV